MPVHKFKLTKILQETPEVKTFRFEPLEPFTFEAGQFVVLKLGNESRAYSISSHPSEHFIELTIHIGSESYFPKKVGQLKIGDVVELDGPYGRFLLGSGNNAVFIGAGVGIAGLRALWSELLKRNGRAEIIYSARTEREIIWHKELEKMRAVFTLTREQPADWNGELGRIDAAMISRHVKDVHSTHYYICGPPEMVKATEEVLLELGVPAEQIKAESWGGIAGSV